MTNLIQNNEDTLREIIDKSLDATQDINKIFSSQKYFPLFIINENGLSYNPIHGSFYKLNSESKLVPGDFLYVKEYISSPSSSTLSHKIEGKEIAPRRLSIIESKTNQIFNQSSINAQKYSSNMDNVQNYLKENDLLIINLVNDFVYNQKKN
jgi:hypothetical protein